MKLRDIKAVVDPENLFQASRELLPQYGRRVIGLVTTALAESISLSRPMAKGRGAEDAVRMSGGAVQGLQKLLDPEDSSGGEAGEMGMDVFQILFSQSDAYMDRLVNRRKSGCLPHFSISRNASFGTKPFLPARATSSRNSFSLGRY